LEEHLLSSSVKELPYRLRLDSDDLYRPTLHEKTAFLKWLENELRALHQGEPGRQWHITRWSAQVAMYSTSYQIHKPAHENDPEAVYHLSVVGPRLKGSLEVESHSYGTLNTERVESNVKAGIIQLRETADRERDPQMPRIIVLGLPSGIVTEERQLHDCLTSLLKEHTDLSAIAVLHWVVGGAPPPDEAGLLDWPEYWTTTPATPAFIVYHNSWLEGVKPLSIEAFDDKWSARVCPLK
jgi:hypothetical protein